MKEQETIFRNINTVSNVIIKSAQHNRIKYAGYIKKYEDEIKKKEKRIAKYRSDILLIIQKQRRELEKIVSKSLYKRGKEHAGETNGKKHTFKERLINFVAWPL